MSVDRLPGLLSSIAVWRFLTVLYLLFIMVWILSLNPRARLNQSFFVLCLHAVIWNLGFGFMFMSHDPGRALGWYRFSHIGVAFISPGIFFFTSVLAREYQRNRKRILAAHVLALAFAVEGILGQWTIVGVNRYAWGFYPRYGLFSLVFLATFFLLMVASFANLSRGIRTAQSRLQKKQLQAVLVGFGVAYFGALDFLPAFGIPLHSFGVLFVILFLTDLSWSVARYQLLNPTPKRLGRKVLATVAESIITLDADGFIRMANPNTADLLGYTDESLLHMPFSSLLDPRDVDTFQRIFGGLAESRKEVQSCVLRLKSREGDFVPTASNLSAIRGWREELIGVVLACRDLRELMRSRAIIQEQEEKLQAILQNMPDGVAIQAPDGPVEYSNPAMAKMGAGRIEAKLRTVFARAESPDSADPGSPLAGHPGVSLTTVQDGEIHPRTYEITSVPLRLGGKQGDSERILRIFHDITERKLAEDALRETNRRLQEAFLEIQRAQHQTIQHERLRALGEMASGIAHDFNNALTPIIGFSDVLVANPKKLDDQTKAGRYLQLINTAAKDAAKIVKRLRDFYRQREESDVFKPVDLEKVVDDCVHLTQPKWRHQAQASGAEIAIETRHLDAASLTAGNDAQIREALINLIFNAVDALPNGGKITIRTRAENDHVVLEVEDTGTGMNEEARSRCFEPFFSTKGEQGTGLGLASVYGIVQRHEGTIEVRSRPGKGTTFLVRLPRLHETFDQNGRKTDVSARRLHVLAIDDDALVLNVITEFLAHDGHTVVTACGMDDGVDRFLAEYFDLVIVDWELGGMNGYEVARVVKDIAPEKPVILLTGFGDMMPKVDSKPHPVDLILSKPVTLNDLREAIGKVLTKERR